jgi:hypothetical protein
MNRLIERLCQQGVCEKVSVPSRSTKTHKDSRMHCVRLVDSGAVGAHSPLPAAKPWLTPRRAE